MMSEEVKEADKDNNSFFSAGEDGLPDWMQFVITAGVFGLFFWILTLLFHPVLELDEQHRDLLNIILGTFIASFSKVLDWWFAPRENKEKKKKEGDSTDA
jgi:hypothetical protein